MTSKRSRFLTLTRVSRRISVLSSRDTGVRMIPAGISITQVKSSGFGAVLTASTAAFSLVEYPRTPDTFPLVPPRGIEQAIVPAATMQGARGEESLPTTLVGSEVTMEGGLELWIEKAPFLTLVTLLAILWGGSPVPLAGRGEDHPLIEAVIEGLESGSETFDHSTLDNLLQRHVSAAGRSDKRGLRFGCGDDGGRQASWVRDGNVSDSSPVIAIKVD